MRKWLIWGTTGVLFSVATAGYGATSGESIPNNYPFINEHGFSSSFSTFGTIERTGPFFEKLGTNNRTCETCHVPSDGWGLSARTARAVFRASEGNDALFEFDGHNCPNDDRSTVEARRRASSLLLTKGLIRFNKTLPDDREFDIVAADGLRCATSNLNLSYFVYRKTLPATNFQAVTTVLWDGAQPNSQEGLRKVANGAVFQHSERFGPDIAEEQKDSIVDLGNSLSSAQLVDFSARSLSAQGALGGATNLSTLPPTGPAGFTIYDAWNNIQGNTDTQRARRSIARGQAIFNTKTFAGGQTCKGCHTAPNLGNSATGALFATGTADEAHRTSDIPLYTIRNRATNETVRVTDLGRAGVTGRWADIAMFKPPMLRSLASRAPYFHNSLAATLGDVVTFYDQRFSIGFTLQERQDLTNFLEAL